MRKPLIQGLVMLLSLAAGAKTIAAQQAATPPAKFTMITVFYDGDWIPNQYTCAVTDTTSPEVKWTGAPQTTMSFALVIHDMDSPQGPSDVTHWVLWNIPANAVQLASGLAADASPDGIRQGKNVRGVNGYQPLCPPATGSPAGAKVHHYVFDLYALDTKIDLAAGSSRADLMKAIESHVLGKANVTGIFSQGIDDKTWRWGIATMPS